MGTSWARSSALALFSAFLAAPAWAAGQLVLESNPPGASVTVNGQKLGETPLVHDGLRAGSHQVILTRPGYKPVTLRVTIENDLTTRQRVMMSPERQNSSGELVIESVPSGADVYLDGRWLGKTPLHVPVSTGRHRLSLRLPGYESLARSVNVLSDLTTTQRLTLSAIAPEPPPPMAVRPSPAPPPEVTPSMPPSMSPSISATSPPSPIPEPETLVTPEVTPPPALPLPLARQAPTMPLADPWRLPKSPTNHAANRRDDTTPVRKRPRPTPHPEPRPAPRPAPVLRSASPTPEASGGTESTVTRPGVTLPDFGLPEWKPPRFSLPPLDWPQNPLLAVSWPRVGLPAMPSLSEEAWDALAERARHAGFTVMMLGFVATLGHALWRQRAKPLDWQPDFPSAGFHLLAERPEDESRLAARATLSAIARAEFGDWPQAVADLNEAYRLLPSAETAYNLALGWELTGMPDWAELAYRTALQLDPQHRDAGLNLANLLVAHEKPLEAWLVYRVMAERHPGDGAIAFNRGNLHAALGQLALALSELKRAKRLLPMHAAPAANLRLVRRRRYATIWTRALRRPLGPR